jgi:hypothetical protein
LARRDDDEQHQRDDPTITKLLRMINSSRGESGRPHVIPI